jgi:hypothetical protein
LWWWLLGGHDLLGDLMWEWVSFHAGAEWVGWKVGNSGYDFGGVCVVVEWVWFDDGDTSSSKN